MITVEPNMNVFKQIEKGLDVMNRALAAGDTARASYAAGLIVAMVEGAHAGRPQPWSWWAPRIDEEFS
jgi:hypothetical protein